MSLKILETPYYSLAQGELPKGCQSCVKGEKLVLFVTGLCPASCFFCPLSEEKKNKDVIWANEQQLEGTEEQQIRLLIAEAKANRATGAGITGGDPLARLTRTCNYIRALKAEFGKEFHIHLYTPLVLVNEQTMQLLHDAGLDEIRFHPSLENDRFWSRMAIARNYPWDIGIEIPVLPDKVEHAKKLIDYAARLRLMDFVNLNELEISERTIDTFEQRGYQLVRKESYAVAGSRDAAIKLMQHCTSIGMPVHFCTTTLKDRVQMGNRIIRRAENVAQPFDVVDDEGLLNRGAIYVNHPPSFGYAKMLKGITEEQREKELVNLMNIYRWLHEQGMPLDGGVVDLYRMRILLSVDALTELIPELKAEFPNARPFAMTEYPTSDGFIVEMEELWI